MGAIIEDLQMASVQQVQQLGLVAEKYLQKTEPTTARFRIRLVVGIEVVFRKY